jgi:hypothetical protein
MAPFPSAWLSPGLRAYPNDAFAWAILLTLSAGSTIIGTGSWTDRRVLDPRIGAGVIEPGFPGYAAGANCRLRHRWDSPTGLLLVAMCRGTWVWAAKPVALRAKAGCRRGCRGHQLAGGGRLQAVDEVRRALCVAGGGEDRAVVGLEDVQ